MKQYTQSELQKMYMEPSEELKDRIHQEISSLPIKEQEEEIVKKKLSFSFVSVIAILLALVAVAYGATEVYHRISVNWKGETVAETEFPIGPEPTVAPPPDAQMLMRDEELSQMADELLHNAVAEDEYGVVSYETAGGRMGRVSPNKISFESRDEFREFMIHSSELTLPTWIPDGYEFREAKVMISCKADGEYKLIEERQEGKITLKRYKIDDSDSVIVWYVIDYRESGDENHYLIVGSSLTDDLDADERTFDLTDGQSASVITVPGMDDALAIARNDPEYNSLAMRRSLNHSIECCMDPMYAEASVPIEPTVFTCENIYVSSPCLDVETLQKIFTPE